MVYAVMCSYADYECSCTDMLVDIFDDRDVAELLALDLNKFVKREALTFYVEERPIKSDYVKDPYIKEWSK